MDHPSHVLVIAYPAQGHINPTLEFAKRLIGIGVDVTFATTIASLQKMAIAASGEQVSNGGLRFMGFSDGFDTGYERKSPDDRKKFMSEVKSRGSEALRETIVTSAEQGRPVTCLVYALLLPWAAIVAQEANIPCALLWIQPATVLNVYYQYFHGFQDEVTDVDSGKCNQIQLPGIVPFLLKCDLPSFLLPSSDTFVLRPLFQEIFQVLNEVELKAKVLVNTFDTLEPDAISVLDDRFDLFLLGPLIPSAFLDCMDRVDKSTGADLFQESVGYIDWLDSKSDSSVVYVSFGSMHTVPKAQAEEISKGLIKCGRPFIWVIRENIKAKDEQDETISCLVELEKLGQIVPWCSQLKVLTHPALGCFLTHCGWNSTLESMSCGVPVVAFPQWSDQGTNAKLIEDVWKIGVRVTVDEKKGLVESDEIARCIEEVMDSEGTKAKELRENAMKWNQLASEALQDNGSSHVNLKAFLKEIEPSK